MQTYVVRVRVKAIALRIYFVNKQTQNQTNRRQKTIPILGRTDIFIGKQCQVSGRCLGIATPYTPSPAKRYIAQTSAKANIAYSDDCVACIFLPHSMQLQRKLISRTSDLVRVCCDFLTHKNKEKYKIK